ncbi:hypothetical protein EVAR_87475_1 [Eumeta japonica]|uniref:Uncharacterized protein n=1 Tax=Eumeta variegata TaxID=151549 RepID=A0A4C1VX15_EUMVA|nr:hypothetical protein EVAR_87475_1 [Eumeta japonica]
MTPKLSISHEVNMANAKSSRTRPCNTVEHRAVLRTPPDCRRRGAAVDLYLVSGLLSVEPAVDAGVIV